EGNMYIGVSWIALGATDHHESVREDKYHESDHESIEHVCLIVGKFLILNATFNDCLLLRFVPMAFVQLYLLLESYEIAHPLTYLNVEEAADETSQCQHQANGAQRIGYHFPSPDCKALRINRSVSAGTPSNREFPKLVFAFGGLGRSRSGTKAEMPSYT